MSGGPAPAATTATFTIDAGGTLKTSSITGVADSTYAKFVLALTGGTIEALQSNPDFMPANFTNAPVIGAGGITFNTPEFVDIGIAQPLAGGAR